VAKRFDATIKGLVEAYPADWLAFAGLPAATALEVVDADVSSVSAAADKVIRVPTPYIAHIEFQASADVELDARMLLYNVLLRWRHRLPVRTVVVLLRPQADSKSIGGSVMDSDASDSLLHFRYRIVRAWQQPRESLLNGGLGTLPLAPISNLSESELAPTVDEVWKRLISALDRPAAVEAITATAIIAGLRFPDEVIEAVVAGVMQMEESSVYQAILKRGVSRGRIEEAREMLLRIYTRRFGPPPAGVLAKVQAMSDVEHIENLVERGLDTGSWEELLNLVK
jgi:predicted transposase YdaD